MAAIDSGSNSAGLANVDAGYNLNVTLPLDLEYSGYARPMSEVDAGNVTGTARLLAAEVSEDYRTRSELDSLLDDHKFNEASQAFKKHKYINTTMTNTWGGYLTTNSSNITTTTTGTLLQTYRHFPIFSAAQTYCYFKLQFTGTWAVTNTVIDIGLYTSGQTNPFTPTDGVYFRADSSGLKLVANYNGIQQTSSAFKVSSGGADFIPALGESYDCILTVSDVGCVAWMDLKDGNGLVVMARLSTPSSGVPLMAGSAPFTVRHAIFGGAASAVMNCKIAKYTVTNGGFATNRLWPTAMVGMGNSSVQSYTAGLANYANSAAPTSASLANTTAGYTTLGGQWQFAAVAGAETDYALFAFQVPAATVSATGRNLIIRGVWIETFNMGAAVATTPTLLQWSLGVGSTAVSLATADAAATRARAVVPLGVQSLPVGAAIGAAANRIDINLDAPVVAEPSTFVHIILKMPVGTATASQIVRGVVGINGYFE